MLTAKPQALPHHFNIMGSRDVESSPSPIARSGTPLRRVVTTDLNDSGNGNGNGSPSLRQRNSRRLSTQDNGPPSPGIRRRSSTFSDYSIRDARRSLADSTEDLLSPRPMGGRGEEGQDSAWHSAPLAFALLPAVGGMIFKNGSSVITDIMLLGLAAIFLNWSVRVPWDWYHSAQAIRKLEEYNGDSMIGEESEEENALSFSKDTLDEVPEEEAPEPVEEPIRKLPAHEHATNELYSHEILALLSCFILPVCGAYLLHTIRSQLTRPSEGLVSNYNLTIFLLAAEIRPIGHLVKLVKARTLHLQRVVNSNPYNTSNGQAIGDVKDITRRLEDLEARNTLAESSPTQLEPLQLTTKQSLTLTTTVRQSIQPDFDALNRAVRRYEKRATLQAFQTDSRIHELEARLNDAISLAAAAADSGRRGNRFSGILTEWAAMVIVMPIHAVGWIFGFPWRVLAGLMEKLGVWGLGLRGRRGAGERSVERGRKSGLNGNGNGNGGANGNGIGSRGYISNGRLQRGLKK